MARAAFRLLPYVGSLHTAGGTQRPRKLLALRRLCAIFAGISACPSFCAGRGRCAGIGAARRGGTEYDLVFPRSRLVGVKSGFVRAKYGVAEGRCLFRRLAAAGRPSFTGRRSVGARGCAAVCKRIKKQDKTYGTSTRNLQYPFAQERGVYPLAAGTCRHVCMRPHRIW